jgi:putative ATP-dependent endonuclease of OLD family
MHIRRITLEGYRAFQNKAEVMCGGITTFIGKNDVGKSSILHALEVFFNGSPEESDFNRDQDPNDPMTIEISFDGLPGDIELEAGTNTTLVNENLVGESGFFIVRKKYLSTSLKKPKITYRVKDFTENKYQNICSLPEKEINDLGKALGLDFKRSGAGITNKGKRDEVRQFLRGQNEPEGIIEIEPARAALRALEYLPDFSLFEADESLNEEGTAFQKEFTALVELMVQKIDGKAEIEKHIEGELDIEINKIHKYLMQHTDEVSSIKSRPSFQWKDLISFHLECQDKQGRDIAFKKRGSGLRRLLMVAYFQYRAQRVNEGENLKQHIYGIEEPETYLHPGAQRQLFESFKEISKSEQIFISSHAPVFAGSTDLSNLILVVQDQGVAKTIQGEHLDLGLVSEQLGIDPSDQLFGFSAIVFLEGVDDCDFFETVATTLHACGKLPATFKAKNIGLLHGGGDDLKHWVNRKNIKRLNKHYTVIMDSDRNSAQIPVSAKKLALKANVERDGGTCHILRKREIENYIHPETIKEHTGKNIDGIDHDFSDLKQIVGSGIAGLAKHMTAAQIAYMDRYIQDGAEKNELREICLQILGMVA